MNLGKRAAAGWGRSLGFSPVRVESLKRKISLAVAEIKNGSSLKNRDLAAPGTEVPSRK
jgi:hypothetical protein